MANSMERELKVLIPGANLNIYSKLYGSFDQPLVIFVHGLTGHMDEHLFYNGARYFYEQGLTSFRWNLYHWENDARKLTDCTLATHAADLDIVIDYCREQGAKKIFVIGHSYGGPTIMLSPQKKFDSVVLWNSGYNAQQITFSDAYYLADIDSYRLRWGYDILIGKAMYEEAGALDWDNLIQHIHTPIKIITAGKGILAEAGQKYFAQANEPKAHHIIPNADHSFTEEGALEELFEESINWVKMFI